MMGMNVFRSLSAIMILRLLQTTNMIAALKNDRSVAEEYFEIFDENVTPLDKRGYQRSGRLLSFVETARSAEDLPGFNLSMDVSGCGRSVQMNTVAGIYTYYNGTTHDNATVGDILADLTMMVKWDGRTSYLFPSNASYSTRSISESRGIYFTYF